MKALEPYRRNYSEDSLRRKLGRYAKAAGQEAVEKTLLLYYALQRQEVPRWARAAIVGALGYFIAPVDAIPDLIPGVGYSDDLGVLLLALATVTLYVDDEVRAKAERRLDRWFGSSA